MTTLPADRELTPEERELILWLISQAPETEELKLQIDKARVVGLCGCGCPTVDITVTGVEPAKLPPYKLGDEYTTSYFNVGDFLVEYPPGVVIGVRLDVRNGLMTELEIYSANGGEPILLPPPEIMDGYINRP